jgi:hypothetical protein
VLGCSLRRQRPQVEAGEARVKAEGPPLPRRTGREDVTKPASELEVVLARLELAGLDVATRGLPDNPVVVSVCKAVTIAQLHSGVESRVLCKTKDEAVDVACLLIAHAEKERGRWDMKNFTLELPNGSAVVMKWSPAGQGKGET